MTARYIPAATATVNVEDATLDLVCFSHAARALGDTRQAGRLSGYVEATLDANPGLAASDAVLPLGQVIRLPAFAIETQGPVTVRLWD